MSGAGAIDLSFAAAKLDDVEVFDVAMQLDGKVVAAGRTIDNSGRSTLTVFRLLPEGPLDPTFGTGGVQHFPNRAVTREKGTSVALDADGRIVVAGSRNNQLIVLRLLENGALDDGFGSGGVVIGPSNDFKATRTRIVRTSDGGYRIMTNSSDSTASHCRVIALTANGSIASSFGDQGSQSLDAPSAGSTTCNSMVAQSDGRLLVGGNEDAHGFAQRLMPDGQPDNTFAASTIASAMEDVTAVAVGADGRVVVGGYGPSGIPGALIARLQADGQLDVLFGNAGYTWIDLPSDYGTTPSIHDMTILPNGAVLAAGGGPNPVLVRLLGTDSTNGPGVLGIETPSVSATEQGQKAVVKVRRTGGKSGKVSVKYQTQADDWNTASGGQDYTQTEGRLEWGDGDIADKEILVPIASNDDPAEEPETFTLALSDVQGGAGLGTSKSLIEIAADGAPYGQFALEVLTSLITEPDGSAQILVERNFYSSGPVSVTLTATSGTAQSGSDFVAQPVTVSWKDGESAPITVTIPIRDDKSSEGDESFAVSLSSPTGGAILGPHTTGSIAIIDNDQATSAGGGGGGGQLGFLSLLFLTFAKALRLAGIKRMRIA